MLCRPWPNDVFDFHLPIASHPKGAFFVAFAVRWRLPKSRLDHRPSGWFTGRVTAVVVVAVADVAADVAGVVGVAAVAVISWLAFTDSCRAPDGAFFVAFAVRWRLPEIRVGLRLSDWFTGQVTTVVVAAAVVAAVVAGLLLWLRSCGLRLPTVVVHRMVLFLSPSP